MRSKVAILVILALAVLSIAKETNLLLNKKVTMSSLYSDKYPASKAVDGITNTRGMNFSHTKNDHQPWLQVEMDDSHHIGTVVIYNREDCCSDRLRGFYVHVGDNPDISKNPTCGGIKSGGGVFDCDLKGKFVGVRIYNRTEYLHIVEMKAFAGFEMAVGKIAHRNPPYGGWLARNAVQGVFDGNMNDGSCFHTAVGTTTVPATFTVDLAESRDVGSLVVMNRRDCCSERLKNFKVRVGDDETVSNNRYCPGTYTDDSVDPYCGMRGRYVTVELIGNPLHLCGIAIIETSPRLGKLGFLKTIPLDTDE